MKWEGRIVHIYIARSAGLPMEELQSARLIAGVGIDGDRYATGLGFYSSKPRTDRQITLIEIETLEALERDESITLLPAETRRNVITQGVPLNHLVGKMFLMGAVQLFGRRLNHPCAYLEQLLNKPVLKPLLHRSGLNCEILTNGVIHTGDLMRPDDTPPGK